MTESITADKSEAALRNLVAEGVLTLPIGHSDIPKPSEAEQRALAERLGNAPGKPLSQIILDERGEW